MAHDETDLPASIAAAWGLRGRPTKGPKPGLSLEGIVAAAVELAVAEGIAAVSMSRVAKAIGSSPMALYRYVASKDELLLLMTDAALGSPATGPRGDWRAGLTHWCRVYHDALRRHPWVLQVPISAPPITPNQIAWMEDGLAAMAGTPLSESEKLSTILLLSGFVRNEAGLAQSLGVAGGVGGPAPAEERAEPPANDRPPSADAEQPQPPIMPTWSGLLRQVTDPHRFPALTAALDSGVFDQDDGPEDEFNFGLARILDGVAVLMDTGSAPPARP